MVMWLCGDGGDLVVIVVNVCITLCIYTSLKMCGGDIDV